MRKKTNKMLAEALRRHRERANEIMYHDRDAWSDPNYEKNLERMRAYRAKVARYRKSLSAVVEG
jgi:hypothetical protein